MNAPLKLGRLPWSNGVRDTLLLTSVAIGLLALAAAPFYWWASLQIVAYDREIASSWPAPDYETVAAMHVGDAGWIGCDRVRRGGISVSPLYYIVDPYADVTGFGQTDRPFYIERRSDGYWVYADTLSQANFAGSSSFAEVYRPWKGDGITAKPSGQVHRWGGWGL